MDFHAAMETFAEAWVAANAHSAVNSGPGSLKKPAKGDKSTMLPKEQATEDNDDTNTENTDSENCPRDDPDSRSECTTPVNPQGSMSPLRTPLFSPTPRSSPVTTVTSPSPVMNRNQMYPSLKTPSPRKPDTPQLNAGGRSLPVHCIIEQINNNGGNSNREATDGGATCKPCSVQLDSYAILPATTPLRDLVRTALAKLGYSSADSNSAKGAIQLKNWRALSFDVITDDTMTTIDDILGELINSATLRIRLSSQPKLSSADEMKEKLLQLLLTQSQSLLLESGCPIEKTLLTAISKGDNSPSLPEDLCSAFNSWYNSQIQRNKLAASHGQINGKASSDDGGVKVKMENGPPREMDFDRHSVLSNPKPIMERTSSSSSSSASASMSTSSPTSQSSSQSYSSTSGHQPQTSPPQLQSPSQGAVLTPSKTRIRTSFDPEHEIPRLQKWFTDNQHPTREQMVRYMNELNNLESRKGRRPLDLTNIIYWFKNARAAQRRATKALDDSFENEENVDVNNSIPASPSEPPPVPFLPNKNAVYVIPFPYHSPHSSHPHHMLADSMAESYDEPCDLSIKKLRDTPTSNHVEARATPNGRSRSEGLSQNGESNKPAITHSCKRSPVRGGYSMKANGREDGNGHKSPAVNGYSENLSSQKSLHPRGSEFCEERFSEMDKGHKYLHTQYGELKEKDGGNKTTMHGGVKAEAPSDDDDNSDPSEESDGSGRLKINEDEDEIDYGARVRNGLGLGIGGEGLVMSAAESSAASMAALSLAQMSQPLHIPQLAPHLAMYYPMAPRFYPPTPSHHAQSSAAATAAMVAALSNSAHLGNKPPSAASSMSSNAPTPNHPGTPNRSLSHQPSSHPSLSMVHSRPHSRGSETRKRRTRVFIDPLTEIPKLEKWFIEDTHPSAYMIDKYTEALNSAEYRQKFPRLEPKNIQLWFKNHRAKVKRMRLGLELEDSYCDSPPLHGARNSPMPDRGSREETGSSSPGHTSSGSGSKNGDESSGGCGGENGNEDELMDEDAQ